MVVEHKVSNTDFVVEYDYEKYFHDSWLETVGIENLIRSEYMDNLMHYIFQIYDRETLIYPAKANLFKSFLNVDLNELKVVILNECPPASHCANGNGFGEYSNRSIISAMNPGLRDIEKCVTKGYPSNEVTYFDKSLRDWNQQGVMVLNTCLFNTSVTNGKFSEENKNRQLYFKNFVREVIKTISDETNEVIFVFTDDSQEEDFNKYIDPNFHYVLKTDGFNEDSTIFDDINQLLLENAKNPTNWDEVMISW